LRYVHPENHLITSLGWLRADALFALIFGLNLIPSITEKKTVAELAANHTL